MMPPSPTPSQAVSPDHTASASGHVRRIGEDYVKACAAVVDLQRRQAPATADPEAQRFWDERYRGRLANADALGALFDAGVSVLAETMGKPHLAGAILQDVRTRIEALKAGLHGTEPALDRRLAELSASPK
jgi:hypothetical protein